MLTPVAYSPAAAAEVLQVSRQTIYNLIARGELASVKIGRSRRIPARAIAELLGEGGAADA